MLDENVDIGTFEGRLAVLDDLYNRSMQIIEEREVAYGDDPFGKTGLYTRKFKIGGSRECPMIVEEYAMDHGLLRALRKLSQAAAKERRFAPKKGGAAHKSVAEYTAELDAGRARVVAARAEWARRDAAQARSDAEAAAKSATQADESPET